jgi:hypothetical protein
MAPLQLAFLVLNAASIAEPENRFRENVEFIFFPDGRSNDDFSVERSKEVDATNLVEVCEKTPSSRSSPRGRDPVLTVSIHCFIVGSWRRGG